MDADSTQPPSQMSTTDLSFPIEESTQMPSQYSLTIPEYIKKNSNAMVEYMPVASTCL